MPIQQFANARNIKYLFHFTRVENLPSILARGLLPLDHLAANGIAPASNDPYRIDGTYGTCLSIGFPNYKMFYTLRMNNPDVKWAILVIKASVLWERDCAFCRENAAKAAVTSIPLPLRKGIEALTAMFADYPDVPRATLGIPDAYPTHPQAEVLVFEPIPLQDIVAIIFNDSSLAQHYAAQNLGPQIASGQKYSNYFYARTDFDKWKAHG